jgi:succinate dehydrogenase cytochrome b subunit
LVSDATTAPTDRARDSGGSADSESRGAFLLRSLHSLTGVVPTGVFMLVELWTHAKALHGPDAHRAALERLAGGWLLLILVAVPMAFHAGYGLSLVLRTRYTIGRYPVSANWNYTLQRVTGVVALLFIVGHVATFWWPLRSGAVQPNHAFDLLTGRMSSTVAGVPWVGLGYALGLSACLFHFANGLRSFVVRWGLVTSAAGRRRADVAAALLGIALWLASAPVVVYLATGSRLFSSPQNVDATPTACEAPSARPTASASASASAAPSPPGSAP